ncbi:MAG: hypothetical protein WBL21_09410, partial [Salinimicrobium sp.]
MKKPLQFPLLSCRTGLIYLFILIFQFTTAQEILVAPYLQPGNASDLEKEEKVLIWQTDSVPGMFKVEFSKGSIFKKSKTAKTSFVDLNFY